MKFRQLTVDNANQELNLIGDGFPVPAATGRHAFPKGEGFLLTKWLNILLTRGAFCGTIISQLS